MTAPLIDRVRQRLVDTVGTDPSASRVALALRDEGVVLGEDGLLDLVATLRADLAGAGPLERHLADPAVTDILVNGPSEVWIDRGDGLQRSGVRFRDENSVRLLAQRLAAAAGRRLDEAAPYVDARLADGTRVHAVIPPIAASGTLISLRVPRRRAFTMDDLMRAGTVTPDQAACLTALIDARLAFLISGGTGTGKTTILSTLLGLVDHNHRILLVEDSAELRPEHPHVIRLESRPANLEGAGSVSLRDLVRQALRMRPDRVVVGEVRGAEVVDLLSALNTGHEGGCGTVHANSATDVPARLEALGLTAGLPRAAVHALVGAGLDAVIHLRRGPDRVRQLDAIHVLMAEGSLVRTEAALTRVGPGPGWPRLVARLGAVGVAPPEVGHAA
jgi:pilus assembly protein CpaF